MTRPFGRRSVALLGAVLVAGCGSQSPAPSADSGVQGRTMVDGGCPVVHVDTPCPNKPLAAKIVVRRSDTNAVVATAASDNDGTFRVALAPGGYILRAVNLSGTVLPRADDVTVAVEPGKYRDVMIAFDSGVRGPTQNR